MVYAIVRNAVVIAAIGYLGTKAVAQTSGTWIATGTMGITRYRFTATLLRSGKVLTNTIYVANSDNNNVTVIDGANE